MSPTNWKKLPITEVNIKTRGESLYEITNEIREALDKLIRNINPNGTLYLFIPHTSCALTINEAFDPTAREDLEKFLSHLAPRNLKFIKHKAEGEDDSPSHMKSILLQSDINLIIQDGKIEMGTWQGIYLAEFRDGPHERRVLVKYRPDF